LKAKKSIGRIIFEIFNTVLMILMVLISIYPIWYTLIASVSDSDSLMRLGGGMLWLPVNFNLTAYQKAFANSSIATGYMNTLFVVVSGVFFSMLFSTIGAYFLSRENVMFQRQITFFIIFTMWFSGGLIPFYIAVRDAGMLNSRLSLIIPSLISTFNMIILRTAFAAVPSSLSESAVIDGAGHLTVLFRIMIPLSGATLAVIGLYYGVSYWNAWFNASIFLQSAVNKWPLQLVLRQILIVNDTSSMTSNLSAGDQEKVGESIQYAVIIIATLPILFIYPFIQKYFVSGVMVGAVKG